MEYTLSDLGVSLKPVIASLFDWGMAYKEMNGEETNPIIESLREALH